MMQTPPMHDASRPSRAWANRLSTVLFIAAILLAGVAAYLYFVEDSSPEGPVAPTAEAGRNEFATVINALKDAGLNDVDPGRYSAEANQLDQPGQTIEIGDNNLFVFIYPDSDPEAAVAAREADAADLDPSTLELRSRSAERPLNEDQDSHIFQSSNVIVILVGGDEELVSTVQDAIESLP
jgi:hypothetical protein